MSNEYSDKAQLDQTHAEQQVFVLTAEESVWFANFLAEEVWEPTEALLRAAARHREMFGE